MVKIFPSILSCDFSSVKKELEKIEKAKADGIHIDIMDGHFVKNFSIGPDVLKAIRKNTKLFLDVHLMIYSPFDYIETFISNGADSISFHFEATEDVQYTLKYIKRCGKKAGLAFNPETSSSLIIKYLDKCDFITFMGVTPGFAGQNFKEEILQKILLVKDVCKTTDTKIDILVDGGINKETAKKCKDAGCDILVSGSYLFSQFDMKNAIDELKSL